MPIENDDEVTIDLGELFRMLWHNAIWIVLCTVAAAAIGFCVTEFAMVPQYQSAALMIVNTRQDVNANVTNDQITSATKLVDTYSIIVKSDTVLQQVIDELGLNLNYKQLNEKVTVEAVNSTQVMRVSVQDANPEMAQLMCQKITEVAPAVIQDAVEAGSVKVISQASMPVEPVSPSVVKNTAIGGLLGLVLCVGVLVVRMLLNNKINTEADVQKYLDLPVLGVIPKYEGGKRNGK